ncbi:MAG: metalloregulator ArsR/SmtB family transcription factor [Patescibacteria group bacterium]
MKYLQLFEHQAVIFKALAHPQRLELIQLLRNQELSVSEIYQMLLLPQAKISQHLMVLREVGVVRVRKEGRSALYSLSDERITRAHDAIRAVLVEQHQQEGQSQQFLHTIQDLLPIQADPVCGMRLSPKTSSFIEKYQGKEYFFCASRCVQRFKQNPHKYVVHQQESHAV